MKIMHVISSLNVGGAQTALINLLSGGLGCRFENQIVILTGTESPDDRVGVPCRSLGMAKGRLSPFSLGRLRHVVREFCPDLVQGWMYHGNLAALLARCLAPGRPAVAWNVRHSLYRLNDEKPMTRQVIRANCLLSARVDAILYNSECSRRQHEDFGFSESRGHVIPNGFDLGFLRPEREHGKWVRKELGIPDTALVVGHVARFHPMKDHESFLRTAVRIAETHSDVSFLLVGREVGLDNPALTGIVPIEMKNRFLCLGERHDVSGLMQAMDVFCQSSWSEAFPNVLCEAMATGVPCVATDVGDSADIVGDTGVIVPPRDEDALVRGVLAMLSMTGKERGMLGKTARAQIEANYALPRIVERYVSLYEGLRLPLQGNG